MSLSLKRIHELSEPICHLSIYDEHLYELVTPQYEVIDTRVMNGVEANKLNNTNKRNGNYSKWRKVEC